MIEFRTLGALELLGPDGREHRAVLTQPKRVALLAYLAVATPHRFHRRDTLLGLLWPELDQDHARAALRQALHGLRQALGPVALPGRGDEEVSLDPAALWCDARAFDESVAAGDAEKALDLYCGDFLTGFFLSGARNFERWVEEERTRLRRSAARAAGTLARQCHAAGDGAGALRWTRRATALAPDDEGLQRQLIWLLYRQGDRASAIGAYESFALRLADEYEAEPAAETQALIAAVRARHVRVPAPTEATAAPVGATPVLGTAPVRRRRRLAPAALAATVGVVALAGVVLAVRGTARPRLDPHRVVVAPFENRTADSTLNALGSMTADWISRGLAETGLVEVADPVLLRAEAGGANGVRALAEFARAGTVVRGALYRQGDSIRFEAQVADARQERLVRSVTPVTGAARDPRAAVEALRQRVTAALATHLDPRLNDWAGIASQPPTFETYQEFVTGYEAFFQLRARDALRHLYRAAALDSTFKLPLVWATLAHSFLNECEPADSLARALAPARDRLGRLDRFLLDRQAAMCRGDLNAAYRMSREMIDAVPQSEFLAWLLARDALAVQRPREAQVVLERLHPNRGSLRNIAPYYLYLTYALHELGDHERELAAAQRARKQFPDNLAMLRLELLALAALGRVPDVNRALDEIPALPRHPLRTPSEVMRDAALELRAHGQPEASRAVFARALAWFESRPAAELATEASRFERLQALYAAGQWGAARNLVGELVREHAESVSYEGIRGVLAARRGARGEAAGADSALVGLWRWNLQGASTYWRACIAAQLGDSARAVTLLWQAHAEGEGVHPEFFMMLHTDPGLEPLRGYARFRAFLKPKG